MVSRSNLWLTEPVVGRSDVQATAGWPAGAVSVGLSEISRPLGEQHADAVIQLALGAPSPGFDALKPGDRHVLSGAVVSVASAVMELDEAAVDELLREAERLAFERGFHPPLVPRRRSGAERS